MSTITINYDTSEKTMSVKLGATELDNVAGVYVYPKWDEDDKFSIEVTQVAQNQEDGIVIVTRTMASTNGQDWVIAKEETKKEKDKEKDKETCVSAIDLENLAKALFPRRFK